ncbi:MAG: M28 family peptidase, partial [Actinomycetota bacterium]|nr:M28 family peptidase [Actinomycetota bacterium]
NAEPNKGAKASRRTLIGRRMSALLVVRLVFVLALGTLLSGCGSSEDKGANNSPSAAAQPVEATSGTELAPPGIAEAAAADIDETSIRTSLDHLTGVSPAPLAGGDVTIAERGSEEGRRAAAEYLKESFEAADIPARIIEFTLDDGRGFNVEATLQGTEGKKHLWVTAHLDSAYNAGASDDASGLVSILLTAKALQQLEPEHTVHFVAYDLEEIGLFGSSRYVDTIVSDVREREGESAILGNINSDMVGYDEGGFRAVMGTCNQAGPLDEAVLRAREEIDSPLDLVDDCLARSDHQNFWDAGYPALILTDGTKYDDYPWYHESGDTVDKLNIPYLSAMIQLNAASTALLAAPRSKN